MKQYEEEKQGEVPKATNRKKQELQERVSMGARMYLNNDDNENGLDNPFPNAEVENQDQIIEE